MDQLIVKKVLNVPSTIEANTLYLSRDIDGRLILTQTDNAGVSASSSYSTGELKELVDTKVSTSPIISGPTTLGLGEVGSYRIINYNAGNTYDMSAINGGVLTRIEDTITYRAPLLGRVGGFIVDTTPKYVTLINPSEVIIPSIISPANGNDQVFETTTVTTSAFDTVGSGDTHASSTWQVSNTNTFDVLYAESANDTVNLTSWVLSGLDAGAEFFVRVKHTGLNLGESDWSPISSFSTAATLIQKPTITNPADNATDIGNSLNATVSAFTVVGGSGNHASTDWQLASDSGFSNIIESSTDDAVNLTAYSFTGLSENTQYYLRARYKADTDVYSEWTDVVTFTTVSTFETAPIDPSIVQPLNNATDVGASVAISTSAFAVASGSDTHVSSSWQVATDAGFTALIVDSANDTTNKTSYTVSSLLNSTTYYARVKHTGAVTGSSEWSSVVTFSTLSTFVDQPNIPSIVSPADTDTGVSLFTTITSNAFGVASGTDTHVSSSWQLSTDSGFATVDFELLGDTDSKTSWTPGELNLNTLYYARVKHIGATSGESDWSAITSFTTREFAVDTPTITSPGEGSSNNYETVTVTSSNFASEHAELHTKTDWQVSYTNDFISPDVESLDDTVDLTSFLLSGLTPSQSVYVRVRYKDSLDRVSAWSPVLPFSTADTFITNPTITSPTTGATNQGPAPTITTSAFGSGSGNQVHLSTDWQVSTVNNFTSTVMDVVADTTNLLSIAVSPDLDENTTYYVRARHNSADFASGWSAVVSFSTAEAWVTKPTITSPTNGAIDLGSSVTITTSAFNTVISGLNHVSTDWEVSTDNTFATSEFQSLDDTSNLTSYTVGPLLEATTYYVRARHAGDDEV